MRLTVLAGLAALWIGTLVVARLADRRWPGRSLRVAATLFLLSGLVAAGSFVLLQRGADGLTPHDSRRVEVPLAVMIYALFGALPPSSFLLVVTAAERARDHRGYLVVVALGVLAFVACLLFLLLSFAAVTSFRMIG